MNSPLSGFDANAFAQLRRLISGIDFAIVTTLSGNGSLQSRPLGTQQTEADGFRKAWKILSWHLFESKWSQLLIGTSFLTVC